MEVENENQGKGIRILCLLGDFRPRDTKPARIRQPINSSLHAARNNEDNYAAIGQ
jgi:hypothetical protein